MTVWDRSWAATGPGHTAVLTGLQELRHIRRYFLPPEAFPVSFLLIPSLAIRIIANTMSVLILKPKHIIFIATNRTR